MKKLFITFVAMVVCLTGYAQKGNTEYRFRDTQARLLDVLSNAYVKPLTVELQVTSNARKSFHLQLSKQEVEQDMQGDLENIRSYAVFQASQAWECDVVVAATFNVKTNDEGTGYIVDVIGFPADFVNWKTATQTDYEWIKMEKTLTTSDRERMAASVRE